MSAAAIFATLARLSPKAFAALGFPPRRSSAPAIFGLRGSHLRETAVDSCPTIIVFWYKFGPSLPITLTMLRELPDPRHEPLPQAPVELVVWQLQFAEPADVVP